MIDFSFIVPTRNRPTELLRFLTSMKENTADLSKLEIILGIDEDDTVSMDVDVPGLQIKRVRLQPGQTMGRMNNTLGEASSGRFIMIQNDDIVCRTPAWDDIIRSHMHRYPDDIVLFHCNDLLFKEKLCCFPLVSRAYCELVGLCADDMKRYRIDDNIFDIFCLLSYMGRQRVLYLPQVVFEHINFVEENGERRYYLNKDAFDHDATLYAQRWVQRQRDAVRLLRYIQAQERKFEEARSERMLIHLKDQFFMRRLDLLDIRLGLGDEHLVVGDRVTVVVTTADVMSSRAQACVRALRAHTERCELVILDGKNPLSVGLPKTFATQLESAGNPYIVLMTDDVLVDEGWLEGLFQAMRGSVGIVMPRVEDQEGNLISTGLALGVEGISCTTARAHYAHPHRIVAPDCSLMLIDRQRCKDLRLNPLYQRFLFDLDFGYRAWEQGIEVVCQPAVRVKIQAGLPTWNLELRQAIIDHDGLLFLGEWNENDRITSLRENIWSRYPELGLAQAAMMSIDTSLNPAEPLPEALYREHIEAVVEAVSAVPDYQLAFYQKLRVWLRMNVRQLPYERRNVLSTLQSSFEGVELVEPGVKGFNLFMLDGRYVAVREQDGMPERRGVALGSYPHMKLSFKLRELLKSLDVA
ncbi:MAG: glycosyltransferase family 2 protein [Myxococcota bacterium]